MNKGLILATGNVNKIKEFEFRFKDSKYRLLTLSDIGIKDFDPVENGRTLRENACIKARALKTLLDEKTIKKYNIVGIISDDSGLFVRKLHGRPGVRSARYAGQEKDFNANIEKVLNELSGIYDRYAYMETYVYMIDLVNCLERSFRGKCYGAITMKPLGNNGFAYDPIFFCDRLYRTFGEVNFDIKQKHSARSKAINALNLYLRDYIK